MYKLENSTAKTFDFEYEGKTYSVPARTSLPMSTFRAIRKAIADSDNPEETGFDEIMKLFDEYIPEVMERIDMGQALELFKAYSSMDDGEGATLGE